MKKYIDSLSGKQAPPPPETLSGIITHTKSVEIVNAIKVQYKNIAGKRLKLLLLALQELNLYPKERKAKQFHDACKIEFNWDIASYPAMNDYSFNPNIDEDEISSMVEFLKNLTKDK